MSNFKELNLVLYYDEFKLWKEYSPFSKRIPDNQLAGIIIRSLLMHKCNQENIIRSIQNFIQFTDIPDFEEYEDMNKRLDLYHWLSEGVDLYDHIFSPYTNSFSKVSHVYIEAIEEEKIIKVVVAGRGWTNVENRSNRYSKFNGLYKPALL